MNATYAEKRMRSTMAPEISAAVMIAKVPWKAMNSRWGIAPCPCGSSPTPRRKKFEVSPIQLLPVENASE